MEMDSFKKSLKMGLISGVCTYALYVIFVVALGFLTNWQPFWTVDVSNQTVAFQPNVAISWEIALIIGIVVASLVPVFLMRYEKIKYAFSYIGISFVAFVWLYFTTMGAYLVLSDMTKTTLFCPFTTVDAVYYLVFVFVLGSVIGTAASFVFNFMRNKD